MEGASPQLETSTIKRLSIYLYLATTQDYRRLLRQTSCLQELELTVERTIVSPTDLANFVSPPLTHLHPQSFSTLRFLTVHMRIDLQNGVLLSPYTNLVGDSLAQFVALESLLFNIVLQGSLTWHPVNFMPGRWGQLSKILCQPGACPKIQRVSIQVKIWAGRYRVEAERLAQRFGKFVFPAEFQRLIETRPGIDFSFVTEVVVSDLAIPLVPYMALQ
ncbi:hypothetical protein FA13DRAFT_53832 [Coprinellus micaceus]|uniref:Uncharacterized protein n=1 Tax=Coprinellus micaceus TaxID=71717 RepID=A0A4Y7U212_COPMI|nr:hypothetical protein FA13DRAFT_53832 [Coprinellus micaceus]